MGRRTKSEKQAEVENIIKDYYIEKRLIPRYKKTIAQLNERYESLEDKLRNNKYELNTELNGLVISERVQSNSQGYSEQEKQMYKQCEMMIKEQQRICEKIFKYENEIQRIQDIINSVEIAFEVLTEEEKEFIRLKYGEQKKWIELIEEFHISQYTVKYKNDKIMNKIKKYII